MRADGNIFLVGPMGAGKTTVGRRLAERLNKEFIDSDHEIEERTGTTIAIIFDIEGEDGFRKREARVLQELTALKNTVLATGGGAVLLPENRSLLRERGTVVYLRTTIEEQLRRTRGSRNRPLLDTDEPEERLRELALEREALYDSVADVVVDSDGRRPAATARMITTRLEEYAQASG